MAKFIVYIEGPVIGSDAEEEFEIPDGQLEGLSAEQRDELIHDNAQEIVNNYFSWGVSEVES